MASLSLSHPLSFVICHKKNLQVQTTVSVSAFVTSKVILWKKGAQIFKVVHEGYLYVNSSGQQFIQGNQGRVPVPLCVCVLAEGVQPFIVLYVNLKNKCMQLTVGTSRLMPVANVQMRLEYLHDEKFI